MYCFLFLFCFLKQVMHPPSDYSKIGITSSSVEKCWKDMGNNTIFHIKQSIISVTVPANAIVCMSMIRK